MTATPPPQVPLPAPHRQAPAAHVRRAEAQVHSPAWRARPVRSAASCGVQLAMAAMSASALSLHAGLVQTLQRHPDAAARLAGTFDWQARPLQANRPEWLQADPMWHVIAVDAIDGVFLLHRRRGDVAYVSREGTAGGVAGSLNEWLHTLLALPYWRDLLEYSHHGELAQMQRTALALAHRDRTELPTLEADRALLCHVLALDADDLDPATAIEHLHRAVSRLPAPAVQVEGRPCGGLFGALTADVLTWA